MISFGKYISRGNVFQEIYLLRTGDVIYLQMKECSEVFGPPPPQGGSQENSMQMMMKMKSAFVQSIFSNVQFKKKLTWIQQCWMEILGHY